MIQVVPVFFLVVVGVKERGHQLAQLKENAFKVIDKAKHNKTTTSLIHKGATVLAKLINHLLSCSSTQIAY